MDRKRQKSQLMLAFLAEGRSESPMTANEGSERPVAKRRSESPTQIEPLMEEVCERRNLEQALKRVMANKGGPGVDGMTVQKLPAYLKRHWPKIREQLLAGTYRPQPVKRVEIPKPDGGVRKLGVPTALDRFIQQAVLQVLQFRWDRTFSAHSYGFRPGRSAHQAITQAQTYIAEGNRYTVDIDLEKFFDNIDHSLMMHAVRKHTDCPWILLYVERWLKASAVDAGGKEVRRDRGTPQGGVASPLLANIFLHHVFDKWMTDNFPHIPFERYADDIVVHCRSRAQAKFIHRQIEERLRRCKLEAHPKKTKIVYCKDDDRRGSHEHERFDFLSYTFRPRPSKNRQGKFFVNFSPAMSDKAAKAARATIRSWRIQCRSDKSLEDISRMFKATLCGWLAYFGKYYKSGMYPMFRALNRRLVRWAQQKYKRYRHQRRATHWLRRIAQREPHLFPHWQLGVLP